MNEKSVRRLWLPLPPDPNRLMHAGYGHPTQVTRMKNRWKREAWAQACAGSGGPPVSDPPPLVLVRVTYRVAGGGWRDPDNRTWGLKLVLDLLRLPKGDPPAWRRGLFERKGWLVDDDDEHAVLDGIPGREPVEDRRDEGLAVELVPLPGRPEIGGDDA